MSSLVEPSTPTFPAATDRTWTTTYDAGGLATGETRPGGVTVSRVFDGQGRLTSESGSGAGVTTASRSFLFDVGSRMTSAGSQEFTYDSRGLLSGSTGPQGASTFGFDIVGRMTTRTDASGTSSFSYNNRSDLTSVTSGGTTTSYGWLGSGELDSVSYPAGVNRKYTYDDLGRATNDVVKNSASTVLSQRQYGYNTDSTLATSIVSQAGNPASGSYTYGNDEGARLTSSTVGGVTKTYGFDAAGNRTLADGQVSTFDARNRLVSGAGTSYNWSARGTLASTTGTGAASYAHDGLDRLTQAGAVTYAYDSLDRVTTRTQGATTSFSYAGVETDPVSDGVATYRRSPGGNLYGVVRSGTLVLAGVDRHGDVSFTLNPTTGVIADSTVRDPWGKALGTTGSTPAVGFQGDWTDPTTGLVWMAARWYQPNTGTFTARDTYPGEVGAYATLNRYTYGLNNPLKYNDPTGRVAAPAGCDNACQSAYLRQTGELYDDPADSFNDKYQRGDRDPVVDIYDDEEGNAVIWVSNDVGVAISTAAGTSRVSFDDLAAGTTTTSGSGPSASTAGPGPVSNSFSVPRPVDTRRFMDANGNCYLDENGKPYPKGDQNIYQCLDMTSAERNRQAEEVKKKTMPKSISPSLTREQWAKLILEIRDKMAGDARAMLAGKRAAPTQGTCVGVGVSLIVGAEAQTCDLDVGGQKFKTKSIGYSVGLQVSAGVGPSRVVSNATTIEQSLGWNACLTGSALGSLQICLSIGFDPATGVTTVPPDPKDWVWSAALSAGGKGIGGGVSQGIVLTERVGK